MTYQQDVQLRFRCPLWFIICLAICNLAGGGTTYGFIWNSMTKIIFYNANMFAGKLQHNQIFLQNFIMCDVYVAEM